MGKDGEEKRNKNINSIYPITTSKSNFLNEIICPLLVFYCLWCSLQLKTELYDMHRCIFGGKNVGGGAFFPMSLSSNQAPGVELLSEHARVCWKGVN